MPKRYHINDPDLPEGAVFIGRGSLFGNQFVIGRHGDRDECCDAFEKRVEAQLVTKAAIITRLRGQDIYCFCGLKQRCHGDYLLRIANE